MKEEEWKDVIGYEGIYRISNQGRVMSLKHGKTRIMADRISNRGYIHVILYKNKRTKSFLVARLVAQHFLPDWDKSLQVDHINGVRTENHVDNLRMVTCTQNLKSYKKKKRGTTSKFRGVCWVKDRKKWRAPIMVDGKRKCLGYFDDEEEAARAWDAAAIENGYNPEALNFK
tara:strand:+ start:1124 stop:1639 length:516 start_codon:yes stop_codon:yes gene_type:complete